MMEGYQGLKFPNSHQRVSIGAGQSLIVWEFLIPAGGAAFVESVAIIIPDSNTYYKWRMDGDDVEEGTIDYQIGKINEPKMFNPPLVAKKKIQFIGYNDSSSDQTFEVLCDGLYYVRHI